MRIDDSNTIDIQVSGETEDVLAVTRQLAQDFAINRGAARLQRSPWFSGLFYVTLVGIIIALLLVTGQVLPVWALPIVIVGAVLLVSIVGALQMRQDYRLTERGFLRLMNDVLRRLPGLLGRRPPQ